MRFLLSLKKTWPPSVTGSQIIINPWFWYSHITLPMKNDKSKWDSDYRYEFYDQLVLPWEPAWWTRSVSSECWLFSFQVYKQQPKQLFSGEISTEQLDQTRQQNVLHCYFKSSPTQKVYRKRMKEIWAKFVPFNLNQLLADQARMI